MNRASRRPSHRAFLVLAIGVLGVVLPGRTSIARAVEWISSGWRFSGQNLFEARARVLGWEYANAVEEVKAAIPPDASYVLLFAPGVDPSSGTYNWVRWDLAPRRVWDGTSENGRDGKGVEILARPEGLHVFVVEIDGGHVPRLRRSAGVSGLAGEMRHGSAGALASEARSSSAGALASETRSSSAGAP